MDTSPNQSLLQAPVRLCVSTGARWTLTESRGAHAEMLRSGMFAEYCGSDSVLGFGCEVPSRVTTLPATLSMSSSSRNPPFT